MYSNLAILMCAPATPKILNEFHSKSRLESTILISIWECGEMVGPLIVGPLSEAYGRLPVYNIANICFIICSAIAAESQNMNMLIAFRFFLGASVASTTLNPCIVGDLFVQENRGSAMAVMGMTPFIAPILGPIVGGYISQAQGWRWTFWLVTIVTGAFELGFLLTYRESYTVIILRQKARKLRTTTGNKLLRARHEEDISVVRYLGQSIRRPFTLLFGSSVIFLTAVIGAFQVGYTYIIITTLPSVFERNYQYSEGSVGLTYLGLGERTNLLEFHSPISTKDAIHDQKSAIIMANLLLGIGMISSVILCGMFLDAYLQKKSISGSPKPEYRLPPMILGIILIPIGIIAFGWSAQARVHWIVPIGSTAIVGFAYVAVELATSSYIVDAYGIYAASAMAAITVLRNVLAATLPLAGPPLFAKLDLGMGCTILGLIALLFVPVPTLLMRYGEKMREKEHF